MLSLRAHAIICASLFGALIGVALLGNALQAAGVIHDLGRFRTPFLVAIFALFIAAGLSAVPVMVKLVLGFQRAAGNENVPTVAGALKAEKWIVYGIWSLMATGAVVALPAAIQGGLFNPDGATNSPTAASPEDFGPSSGTLVARPGMTLTDMVRASSLPIDPAHQTTWTGSVVGGAVFDFRIAGTSITFPRCRYYFVATYTRNPQHIESINVGTSASTMSRTELDQANAVLRRRLAADGWLTGHEEFRNAEVRALHGGAARGPDGANWLKNGMVLDIGTRRMDDAAPGEDPATAGRWIQFVDLWPRDDYPSIDRYVFAPWKG